MTTDADRLAAIRARAEGATEGPWDEWTGLTPEGEWLDGVSPESDRDIDVCHVPRTPQGAGDSEFIAHARTDVPWLVAEVERLSAAVEAVRALHRPGDGPSRRHYPANGGYGSVDPYCAGCEASDEYAVAWPCATIRALDGTGVAT